MQVIVLMQQSHQAAFVYPSAFLAISANLFKTSAPICFFQIVPIIPHMFCRLIPIILRFSGKNHPKLWHAPRISTN